MRVNYCKFTVETRKLFPKNENSKILNILLAINIFVSLVILVELVIPFRYHYTTSSHSLQSQTLCRRMKLATTSTISSEKLQLNLLTVEK